MKKTPLVIENEKGKLKKVDAVAEVNNNQIFVSHKGILLEIPKDMIKIYVDGKLLLRFETKSSYKLFLKSRLGNKNIHKIMNEAIDLEKQAKSLENIEDKRKAATFYTQAIYKYKKLAQEFPNSPLFANWLNKADTLIFYAKSLLGGKTSSRPLIREREQDLMEDFIWKGDLQANKYNFSNFGGLNEVKNIITQTIEWWIKYPHELGQHGLKLSKLILLIGPPNCGKTYLVKCIAGKFNLKLFIIPQALTGFNEEQVTRILNKIFHQAKVVAPAIIFFDEIDILLPNPEINKDKAKLIGKILSIIQEKIKENQDINYFFLIMATNNPELLHPFFLKPQRDIKHIYIPIPDRDSRAAIFKIYLTAPKLILESEVKDFDNLARLTAPKNGWHYSSNDLKNICSQAKEKRFEQIIETGKEDIPLSLTILKEAIESKKPSISPTQIDNYDRWKKEFFKIERNFSTNENTSSVSNNFKFCPNCGAKIPRGSNYCEFCRKIIE